jgi:formylglycine-generating enzyme required for sulfatase activity
VRYQLPTEEEWEYAASDRLDLTIYPFGMKELVNNKGAYLVNTKEGTGSRNNSNDWQPYLTPIKSFHKNGLGIYNLIGNISEMTTEKGKSKGGNYTSVTDSCAVEMVQYYEKPEPWLGFRCICEIID